MSSKFKTKSKISRSSAEYKVVCNFSSKNVYAQLFSFKENKILAGVSSIKFKRDSKTNYAKQVGKELADKMLSSFNISKVAFDRNGKIYHGVVKALADSLRENGITI